MRKTLSQELKQYSRCLWPYAIALVLMGVVACLCVLLDRNPVEATGSMTAVGLFILTVIIFAVRGLAHGYDAFYKDLISAKEDRIQSINKFLWMHICAFIIFIAVTALSVLAIVSTFAWKAVGQLFLSLDTDWGYFLEFVLYAAIFTVTVYIIPVAMMTANHFRKRKKLVYSIGTIMLLFCVITIVPEVLLLIHDTSTDIRAALATVISLLVIFALVDIGLYVLTYCTLKTELQNTSSNNIN